MTRIDARTGRFLMCVVFVALAACGDDGNGTTTPGADAGLDVASDAGGSDLEADLDRSAPDDDTTPTDAGADGDDDAGPEGNDVADPGDAGSTDADSGDPTWPDPLTFHHRWPIFAPPADPLAGAGVESCAVFQEERCSDGSTTQRCEIYDVDAGAFDDDPAPMLRRAYLYDRWYDLFSSPDGQTAERIFTEPMPPGTAEEVWSDPAKFATWGGAGDSAIWTGTALNAYILRYLHTGTEADYLRMEEKTRVMLRFFEVTGIPGYLARHHYLLVPEGTPSDDRHIFRSHPDDDDHRDIPNPESLDFLPDVYASGLGTPRWSGDPSIDQMNGPMVAFPMVHGLLRDEALKEQLAYQMTCYLHRLRRIEIINLQDNPDALDAFQQYFAGDTLDLDPGDIDLETLDRIVMYVHPQINTSNEDRYDMACGEFIRMEPWRVIDATAGLFILDVLELVQDISRGENRPNQINHFYIPSIRGGDAMHMMHLALMAYAFTGDERYAEFLRDELLGTLRTAEVAATMSALIMPRYCRRFYGTNITAGPLWAFNNLLADSELDTFMQEVMRDEMWEKECRDIGNVNVNLMFAGAVSPEIGGAAREEALAYALEALPDFGGNGGILDDPRRVYHRTFDEVVAMMPEGIVPLCATEQERAFCEREFSVFGVSMEGETISFECTGASSDCVMEDGLCTRAEASEPLPGAIRRWGDYTWQRSPFHIGDERPDATVQSPGTDYSEQYWMARFYDFIEGNRGVLAWRDTGEACEQGPAQE